MDETFIGVLGDEIAIQHITQHLNTISVALGELKSLLLSVKNLCDPDIYINEVRP